MHGEIYMIQIRIIFGAIVSVILYVGWMFILTSVGFIFFTEEVVINGNEIVRSTISINPIFKWLFAGLIPSFFFAGQYIFCNNSTELEEKISYLRDMKITLIGFSLWLVVIIGMSLFQMNINYYMNLGGGYLIIFIIYYRFSTIATSVWK